MYTVLFTVAAYLIGSISFAVVVSRLFGLDDPRTYGSKNPGATNVLRSGNKKAAIATLAGDCFKGWFAVWLALQLGPRFGVTFLTSQMRDSLKSHSINVGPVISQFGWQFERQFLGNSEGVTAVSEWVFLVGGLDQGTFLPSVSWLVGMRGPNGTEFGVGPNVSAAGASLVIAAGITHRAGALNVPINLAVVPSRDGVRIGLLTGFTMR